MTEIMVYISDRPTTHNSTITEIPYMDDIELLVITFWLEMLTDDNVYR